MNRPVLQTCPRCQQALSATARFCRYCGASVWPPDEPEEVFVAGGKRLRVSQDTLNLRALLAIVESGVAWWQQKLRSDTRVDREQAAAAIKELSRILDSLSQQLAQGRETVRITTRLPTTRIYTVGCPVCGRGNRDGARFCQSCGSLLPDPAALRPESKPGQPLLRLKTAARSDRGQVREQNEDVCYAGPLEPARGLPATLLLVADGMGGAQGGQEASRLASEAARHVLGSELHKQQPEQDSEWLAILQQAVVAANELVSTQSRTQPDLEGMGTTLTLMVVAGTQAYLAHVGDSRAYLFHAEGVTEDGATMMQLTSDHSLVARLVDIGQLTPQEARVHPQRNIIYRSLGRNSAIEVDTSSQPLRVGDRLLLCSDGLTTHVEDSELAAIVLAEQQPEQVCERLIALANQRGGRDNISVAIAMVEGIDRHVRV